MNKLDRCRSCKSKSYEKVVDLGRQYFSGYFPNPGENIENLISPLVLIECSNCSLVQLQESFNLAAMYGENYGYRSGLNSSMVQHLQNKAEMLSDLLSLDSSSRVLDIGANDGTFLKNFSSCNAKLIAIDPTLKNWDEFYDFEVDKYNFLFDLEHIADLNLGEFDLISSISMFYDVLDPISFACLVKSHLSDSGIWHIEMSYLPTMMWKNSYDTICHEHLEYYSLNSLNYILSKSGLKIIDFKLNEINGGSIEINVTHSESSRFDKLKDLDQILIEEMKSLDKNKWVLFNNNLKENTNELHDLMIDLNSKGLMVAGLGASTKGNVILQSSRLNNRQIKHIEEINPRKFGKVTPGTSIPIIPENDSRFAVPDFKLVLPWHFRENILQNQKEYLLNGGALIFPLPSLEIVRLL